MAIAEQSDLFLRACRRQPVERTPVWFMRQAGRYLPEYRALRAQHSLLELCRTPELAAEITLFTVRKLEVDAAIIFADLLLPAQAMGMELDFVEGEGPVLSDPIRSAADLARLHLPADGELRCVSEAIRAVCKDLHGKLPVIGFSGAPFTLASYMIEGGASRDFLHTKRLMFHHPELWTDLVNQLVQVLSEFLRSQVEAGAAALQIFDSWVGALAPSDYQELVLPYSRRIFEAVRPTGVPTIHFGTSTAGLLGRMAQAGADVIAVDWRVSLDVAWSQIGYEHGIQGNLDPTLLLAPFERVATGASQILRAAAARPGHIFNLGHGVLADTPPETLANLVEFVHSETGSR